VTKYFIVDCETTAPPHKNGTLLTVYADLLDENFKVIDSIDLKIRPDDGIYRVDPYSMQVNGIDLVKHHKKATKESKASGSLQDFICRNNMGQQRLVVIGHNVSFDISFLKRLITAKFWDQNFSRKVIDTGSIAEFLCLTGLLPNSEQMNCSLKGLAEHFGFSYDGAHEAKFDVQLTLNVLKRLLALVKESK
jgi:DNA polymerase III epsilon subunit-like protein